MKPFNFIATQRIITDRKKYKSQQKEGKKEGSNKKMLQMYGEMELDPKIQAYCNNMILGFKQYTTNHRSHQLFKSQNNPQYESLKHLRNVSLISKNQQQDSRIKSLRMKLQKLPSYKSIPINQKVKSWFLQGNGDSPLLKTINKIPKQMPISKEVLENIRLTRAFSIQSVFENAQRLNFHQNKYGTRPPPVELQKKFRHNIKLIKNKLKAMNLTMNQIIKFKLFAKDSPPYQFGKKIFKAIKQNRQDLVWRETIENRYSIFTIDYTKKTPVIWASIRGYSEILELLLKSGAPVSMFDDLGKTAMHYSIKYDHQQCTKLLVLYLSDISEQDIRLAAQLGSAKTKSIVYFWKNYSKILKRMTIQKRKTFFFEQQKFHNIKKLQE